MWTKFYTILTIYPPRVDNGSHFTKYTCMYVCTSVFSVIFSYLVTIRKYMTIYPNLYHQSLSNLFLHPGLILKALCSCGQTWTYDHIPTYFCPLSYWMTPNPLSLPPQHKQFTSLREKCSTNPQEILNPVCTGHWMNSNVCSIMCVSSSKSFIKPWRLEETKLSRDSGHTVILELFNLKD